MTRRGRTLVFLLVATALNVAVTLALFVGILLLYNATLGPLLKIKSAAVPLFGSFLVAVVVSSFAYRKFLEALRKRPGFDERFGWKG